MKFRVGIAAALLAAGGAIGLVALAVNSGGAAPTAAAQAGYSAHWRHMSLWTQLNTAMNDWRSSRQTSYAALAGMNQPTFGQTTQHGKMFAEQRGIVVLATNKFVILQSANGSLHLWLLSGQTVFQNVSSTVTGTMAMTGNASATQQAMTQGNMTPAVNVMAGSTQVANQMLAPTQATQTVTVQVAGTDLTVTVTITRNTATVGQTATMPQNTAPAPAPTTFTQNPWTMTGGTLLHRGDLALIVGFRTHGLLHARLVLYTPMNQQGGGTPSPSATPSMTTSASPTVSPAPSVMPSRLPTPAPSASGTGTGVHF